MKTYLLTLECEDGTWGRTEMRAADVATALRVAAQNFVLDGAKAFHLVEKDEDE